MEEEPQVQNSTEIREAQPPLLVGMSNNYLLVDERSLEPSDGPEILQRALSESSEIIKQGLEDYRQRIQELHPGAEVSLAPFSVMYFGRAKERRMVLTDEALSSGEQVYQNINEIKEEYWPFWQAVEAAGYVPEVRIYFFAPSWDVRLWAQVAQDKAGI